LIERFDPMGAGDELELDELPEVSWAYRKAWTFWY
jgi:hypothetical protein